MFVGNQLHLKAKIWDEDIKKYPFSDRTIIKQDLVCPGLETVNSKLRCTYTTSSSILKPNQVSYSGGSTVVEISIRSNG